MSQATPCREGKRSRLRPVNGPHGHRDKPERGSLEQHVLDSVPGLEGPIPRGAIFSSERQQERAL